jgi:hypothetical protein
MRKRIVGQGFLELSILPNTGGGEASASLARLQLA